MRYCLSICVRNREARRIHFCFTDSQARDIVTASLVEELQGSVGDAVSSVKGNGFQKRDFLSFEEYDDGDDGEDGGGDDEVENDPGESTGVVATAVRIARGEAWSGGAE